MASVKRSIVVHSSADTVWDIIRDIGALHTRLVPGFVTDTRVEGEARWVTFDNGMVVREPIVTLDDDEMRLVWGAEGAGLDHYNGAVEVVTLEKGCRITWRADFLPHDRLEHVAAMVDRGMAVMHETLNANPRPISKQRRET